MALIDNVKTDLRITNTDFDTEIASAILTAKKKLEMCGVEVISDTDALTATAVKLFCRGWFNFQGDAERYEKAFLNIADAMALCGDYNEESEE